MRVYTAGAFDLFHAGHVAFLRRCKEIASGDSVTVGLNLDDFIAAYKGRPPVIGYDQRAAVLEGCRYVDAVVPNPQVVVGDSIAPLLPPGGGLFVYSADWRPPRDYFAQIGVTHGELDALGWYLVSIPYTAGVSSSAIRGALA